MVTAQRDGRIFVWNTAHPNDGALELRNPRFPVTGVSNIPTWSSVLNNVTYD